MQKGSIFIFIVILRSMDQLEYFIENEVTPQFEDVIESQFENEETQIWKMQDIKSGYEELYNIIIDKISLRERQPFIVEFEMTHHSLCMIVEPIGTNYPNFSIEVPIYCGCQ